MTALALAIQSLLMPVMRKGYFSRRSTFKHHIR